LGFAGHGGGPWSLDHRAEVLHGEKALP